MAANQFDLSGVISLLASIFDEIRRPSIPYVRNIPIVTAGTEQRISIPVDVRKITIKPRGAALQLSFQEGMSGSEYTLIQDGFDFSESEIRTKDSYLYVQSPGTPIVEVIYWR